MSQVWSAPGWFPVPHLPQLRGQSILFRQRIPPPVPRHARAKGDGASGKNRRHRGLHLPADPPKCLKFDTMSSSPRLASRSDWFVEGTPQRRPRAATTDGRDPCRRPQHARNKAAIPPPRSSRIRAASPPRSNPARPRPRSATGRRSRQTAPDVNRPAIAPAKAGASMGSTPRTEAPAIAGAIVRDDESAKGRLAANPAAWQHRTCACSHGNP